MEVKSVVLEPAKIACAGLSELAMRLLGALEDAITQVEEIKSCRELEVVCCINSNSDISGLGIALVIRCRLLDSQMLRGIGGVNILSDGDGGVKCILFGKDDHEFSGKIEDALLSIPKAVIRDLESGREKT